MEPKKEMKQMFSDIITDALDSGEKWKQDIVKSVSCTMFDMLLSSSSSSAKEIMDMMEGQLCYYNYLLESQAKRIVSSMINSHDKSVGAHWQPQEVWSLVEKHTGDIEEVDCRPYYNRWALYVTVNMIYSDDLKPICLMLKLPMDNNSIRSHGEEIAMACYYLAVSKLCDADRPRWIEDYFRKLL